MTYDPDEALRKLREGAVKRREDYLYQCYKNFFNLSTQPPYEHEFGEMFIKAMLEPNMTHIRRESQGFDVVAYRTQGDADRLGYHPFDSRRETLCSILLFLSGGVIVSMGLS